MPTFSNMKPMSWRHVWCADYTYKFRRFIGTCLICKLDCQLDPKKFGIWILLKEQINSSAIASRSDENNFWLMGPMSPGNLARHDVRLTQMLKCMLSIFSQYRYNMSIQLQHIKGRTIHGSDSEKRDTASMSVWSGVIAGGQDRYWGGLGAELRGMGLHGEEGGSSWK